MLKLLSNLLSNVEGVVASMWATLNAAAKSVRKQEHPYHLAANALLSLLLSMAISLVVCMTALFLMPVLLDSSLVYDFLHFFFGSVSNDFHNAGLVEDSSMMAVDSASLDTQGSAKAGAQKGFWRDMWENDPESFICFVLLGLCVGVYGGVGLYGYYKGW